MNEIEQLKNKIEPKLSEILTGFDKVIEDYSLSETAVIGYVLAKKLDTLEHRKSKILNALDKVLADNFIQELYVVEFTLKEKDEAYIFRKCNIKWNGKWFEIHCQRILNQ